MMRADRTSSAADPADPDLADYVAGWRERARLERAVATAWRVRRLARLPAVARADAAGRSFVLCLETITHIAEREDGSPRPRPR